MSGFHEQKYHSPTNPPFQDQKSNAFSFIERTQRYQYISKCPINVFTDFCKFISNRLHATCGGGQTELRHGVHFDFYSSIHHFTQLSISFSHELEFHFCQKANEVEC